MRSLVRSWLTFGLFLLLPACGDATSPSQPQDLKTYPAARDVERDVQAMHLDVDLTTHTATASLTLVGSTSEAASFEAHGLEIFAVGDAKGPLLWQHGDGWLDVGVAPGDAPAELSVDYRFFVRDQYDGLLAAGSTLVWPYHCGNLFPCKSNPDDGLRVTLDVHGGPANDRVVFAPDTMADGPSYMPAWATGAYTEMPLGSTAAGTSLSAWYLPGGDADAATGTASLVAAFEFFETTLGPYVFGDLVGAIAVEWGVGALGGMEHHPLWHVASQSMDLPDVHIHEAAHGWFGNGVRMRCWEDFVLSEGTVSYLAAVAYEQVLGAAAATTLWSNYQVRLDGAMSSSAPKIAWPEGCGAIDILEDRLFTSIPYMKGAFFFRDVEQVVGRPAMLSALRRFYNERVGTAASFAELLETIAAETGYDANACATMWLRQEALPVAPCQ